MRLHTHIVHAPPAVWTGVARPVVAGSFKFDIGAQAVVLPELGQLSGAGTGVVSAPAPVALSCAVHPKFCRLAQLQQAQNDPGALEGFTKYCDEKKWMNSLSLFVRLAETTLGPFSPQVPRVCSICLTDHCLITALHGQLHQS